MTDEAEAGEQFTLDGVPLELLGVELAQFLRGIDREFVKADISELVWGHVAALTSVMSLLKRLPGFDADLIALKDLLGRLEKLSVGQKKPIMALVDAAKTPGRAPASYLDHIREVRAVALVEAAMGRGWTEIDACKLVASELARIGVRGRRGNDVSDRTVRTWLSEKIKVNDEAFRAVRALMAELLPADLTKSDMKKFARAFISAGEAIRH